VFLPSLREHQALHVLRRRLLAREVVRRHGGLGRRRNLLRRQVHHLYAATRPCIELRVAATTDPLGTALYRATHRGCVRYCFLTPSPLCRPSSGFERSPVSHPRRRVKRRDSQGGGTVINPRERKPTADLRTSRLTSLPPKLDEKNASLPTAGSPFFKCLSYTSPSPNCGENRVSRASCPSEPALPLLNDLHANCLPLIRSSAPRTGLAIFSPTVLRRPTPTSHL
jgi:hypothetical protein